MIKVNKTTMMFESFGSMSIESARKIADDIVFDGNPTREGRDLFLQWKEACGFNIDQGLLVMSTVFPLRIYRSIIKIELGV